MDRQRASAVGPDTSGHSQKRMSSVDKRLQFTFNPDVVGMPCPRRNPCQLADAIEQTFFGAIVVQVHGRDHDIRERLDDADRVASRIDSRTQTVHANMSITAIVRPNIRTLAHHDPARAEKEDAQTMRTQGLADRFDSDFRHSRRENGLVQMFDDFGAIPHLVGADD